MLVFYGILLAILLGLWAWTKRAAWAIPAVIVAILFVATWLNFRWEVGALLVLAVVIIALAILFAKVILGVILGLIALLVAAAIGFGFVIPDFTAAPPPNAAIQAPATSAPASPPATAPTCEAKFVQVKANYGPDNRVDGTFEKAYADTVSNKTGAEKEAAMRNLILKHSANNGQRLAIWAHANGLYANPNDWQKLVAGDCLSKEGQDLYNKLDGALSAGGTVLSEGEAPQNGHNSGTLPDGTFSVADRPGISSDTKAIVITHKDGSKVYILVYCGNVVFLTPPAGVPTSPEIPGPPQKCPEGMNGVPPNCTTPQLPPVQPPPPANVCPPHMPHGTWPLCKDGVAQAPQNQGNLPIQQMPNRLPALPQHFQPTEPVNPGPVYEAPKAAPAPQPAPVGNEPAPNPNPEGPRPTAQPEPAAPAPSEAPSTCAPAPGKTTC